MTTEQLRGMADEAFVEILAQRVVEKLLARQKQALVVYTGSNIGEAAALEAMGRLRGEGFTFRVLLSRGASGLLDVERLRSVLEPEKLWVETPEETPEALTARYDTILVPAMTVHTAAHVAACMADTPASAVILDGLMRGERGGEHRRLLPGSRRAPEARLPYGGAAEAGASEQSGDLALLRRAPDHLRRPL